MFNFFINFHFNKEIVRILIGLLELDELHEEPISRIFKMFLTLGILTEEMETEYNEMAPSVPSYFIKWILLLLSSILYKYSL